MTGKVTLVQLRREAARVGLVIANEYSILGDCFFTAARISPPGFHIEMSGKSRMAARRNMLKLFQSLDDGAFK